jgi:hypothetical protein
MYCFPDKSLQAIEASDFKQENAPMNGLKPGCVCAANSLAGSFGPFE